MTKAQGPPNFKRFLQEDNRRSPKEVASAIQMSQRFGRLVVIDLPKVRNSVTEITCQCDCGSPPRKYKLHNLIDNKSKSCGCSGAEKTLLRGYEGQIIPSQGSLLECSKSHGPVLLCSNETRCQRCFGWFCGIMDGEGSIGIATHKSHRSYQTRLTISNTNRELLETCMRIAGAGSVCKSGSRPRVRPGFCWVMGGIASCGKIAAELIPGLVDKKRRAELLVEFANVIPTATLSIVDVNKRRFQIFVEMTRLNKRGVEPLDVDALLQEYEWEGDLVHEDIPSHRPVSRTPHSVNARRKLPQEFGG